MLIEAYAVRLERGDFAPVLNPAGPSGTLMVRSVHEVRDHRSAALEALRSVPGASHCFTVAALAPAPVCVCWRRSMLAGALGELEAAGGGS